MNPLLRLAPAVLLLGSIAALRGQIAVPGVGATLAFASRPPATEWATRSITGGTASFTTTAALDAAVVTNTAASITTQVLDGGTANPPAANALAQWTGGGTAYLATRPTGNGATLLMARLRNDTGAEANTLSVSYTLGQLGTFLAETIPGHQVYYSLNGAANSWVLVPELSGGTLGAHSHTITLLGNWAGGATLYLLWADSNAPNGTDHCYTLDDLTVVPGLAAVPLSVSLSAPANGQLIVAADSSADVTVSAIAGGSTPPTTVTLLTNGIAFAVLNTPPYVAQLTALPAGSYVFEAYAVNALESALSAPHTLTLRRQYAEYAGGTYSQDFDGMGPSGTLTPIGWYVGSDAAALVPGPGVQATVGDGSLPPDQALYAWNLGIPGDANRALGTLATAADRNTVLRLRNQTSSNLVAFEFHYDGEVWRPNTNLVETFTNYVSYNQGSNWTATGFDFVSPVAPVNPALAINGHDVANRIPALGGVLRPPVPVPPGGVLYLRWLNYNEPNTDGALAIDNFSFRGTEFSSASAMTFTLNSPTNGQVFSGSCGGGATVTVNASASFFVTNVTFQLDGGSAIQDSAAPFTATFTGVPPGAHVITATAQDSFGVVSNLSASIHVVANQLPVVALTNVFSGPVTGLVFLVGTPVTNQFRASDPDGTITNLEFLVNGAVHFATNVTYGQMTVGNALAGVGTYTVRATDNCGGVSQQSVTVTITNPPPPVSILISNGSVWKYQASTAEPAPFDLGGGLLIPWVEPYYDDTTWPVGRAELGGGDAVSPPGTVPERTVIDIGPAAARYRTIYFRHTFQVADPSRFDTLILRSLHDDGSAIYVNGLLAATFNLTNAPGIPITYSNLAAANGGRDGTVYAVTNVAAALLPGLNCVAVEVHQDSVTSSDLSFDCMLWALPPSGPALSITTAGANSTITWSDPALQFKLQRSTDLSSPGNWTDVPGDPPSPYVQALPGGSGHRFFRLVRRP